MSSLMKTLAKVAIGMAVAKGVQSVSGGNRRQAGGGLENILGELTKAAGGSSSAGGLGDILGGLSGAQSGGASAGLNDLLGTLAGSAMGASSTGQIDIGGILGGVLGNTAPNNSGLGGLGGLLEGLATGAAVDRLGTGAGGLGDLLNQSLDSFGKAEITPTADQEDAARYLLAAMLEAAKADGEIDANEKKALMEAMADASPEDQSFVQQVISSPINVDAIVENLPHDMYNQAYAMSLIAIDLNNQAEANHLHSLAHAMGLSKTEVNKIHERMGEPALYT
ncbi:MAG: DUF533 domain-containing protein [Pseudomonadota bacterium]